MREKKAPMELTDSFKFGKFVGATLESVIDDSPQYVLWAINEQIIRLSNDAYNYYRDVIDEYED